MTGTVSPLYEPAMLLKRAGVIPGHDLTSEAALAKLSYLLALELSFEEVTNQMSISLRGEFTEQTSMVFEHPHGVLSSSITNLTSLSYAISKGNAEVVRDLLNGDVGWLLNEADYSGNTPLVSTFPGKAPPGLVVSRENRINGLTISSQHIASTASSLEILRLLLSHGASVHLRNNASRTPLFLAANAGLIDYVKLLKQSGAHLHAEELAAARRHAQASPMVWHAAGILPQYDGFGRFVRDLPPSPTRQRDGVR